MEEAERMARASRYVGGGMGEAERERAEHDLAYDPRFRDAVLRVAEASGRIARPGEAERWRDVAADLSALPHLAAARPAGAASESAPREASAARPWTSWAAILIAIALSFCLGLVVGRASLGIF